jgi:uncharacterized repeat protein (TIGR03803 family)
LNAGTLLRISKSGAGFEIAHPFCSSPGSADGEVPTSIVPGLDGNLYGTTSNGGGCSTCGVVFRFSPASGTYTVLHSVARGESRPGGLNPANDGNFYATCTSPQGGSAIDMQGEHLGADHPHLPIPATAVAGARYPVAGVEWPTVRGRTRQPEQQLGADRFSAGYLRRELRAALSDPNPVLREDRPQRGHSSRQHQWGCSPLRASGFERCYIRNHIQSWPGRSWDSLLDQCRPATKVIEACKLRCAANVTNSAWVCRDCAWVRLGSGLASAASG